MKKSTVFISFYYYNIYFMLYVSISELLSELTAEQREELGWPEQLARPEPEPIIRSTGTITFQRKSLRYRMYSEKKVKVTDSVGVLVEDVEDFFTWVFGCKLIIPPLPNTSKPFIFNSRDPEEFNATFAELGIPETETPMKAFIFFHPGRGG